MQSSPPPPRPPPHRRHATDEQTEYSLDLDALTMDGEDGEPASPSVHQIIDKINSDDIDGPTDFTVNLAKFLRGTPRKQPLPTWQKEQDTDVESAHMLSSPSSDEGGISTQGTSDSTIPRQDEAKKGTLQPTVEDYYSELTPLRPASTALAPPSVQSRSHSTSTQRRYSPSLAPVHADDPTDDELHALRHELQQAQDARNHADELNRSLRLDLESEREEHRHIGSLRDEIHRLQLQSEHYETKLDSLQRDLEQTKASERDAVRLADDRAKELDQIHDTEDAEIHNLRVRLDQARAAEQRALADLDKSRLNAEAENRDAHHIRELQHRLEQSQNSQREAESALEALRTQQQEQETATSDEVGRLQQQLAVAKKKYENDHVLLGQESSENTAQLEARAREEIDRQTATLQTQLDEARREAQSYHRELQDLKLQHHKDSAHDDLEEELQKVRNELEAKDELVKTVRHEAKRKAEDLSRDFAEQLEHANKQLASQGNSADSVDGTPPRAGEILKQLEHQLKSARNEISAFKQQHTSDKNDWEKAEEEAQRSIATIGEQHRGEQEARKKAEDDARILREELNMLQQFKSMDHDRPTTVSSQEHDSKASEALRVELQALQSQLRDQHIQYLEEMDSLKKLLSNQREEGDFSLMAAREEHRRTIDLIEEGMDSLRTSREELRLRCNQLEPDLETSKAELRSLQTEFQDAQQELTESRSSLNEAQSDLETAQTELSQCRAELEESKHELQSTKQELQELHELNEAFDARLSNSLLKREDGWRSKLRESKTRVKSLEERIRALEKEREMMGRALMGMWGREECGIKKINHDDGEETGHVDEGQKFKYRFAKA